MNIFNGDSAIFNLGSERMVFQGYVLSSSYHSGVSGRHYKSYYRQSQYNAVLAFWYSEVAFLSTLQGISFQLFKEFHHWDYLPKESVCLTLIVIKASFKSSYISCHHHRSVADYLRLFLIHYQIKLGLGVTISHYDAYNFTVLSINSKKNRTMFIEQ